MEKESSLRLRFVGVLETRLFNQKVKPPILCVVFLRPPGMVVVGKHYAFSLLVDEWLKSNRLHCQFFSFFAPQTQRQSRLHGAGVLQVPRLPGPLRLSEVRGRAQRHPGHHEGREQPQRELVGPKSGGGFKRAP